MDEEILARLERIERRLDAIEGRTVRPPVVAKPPSISPSSEPSAATVDLEGLIGTRWLPRIGAAAVVSAIAYLVGLGLQKGVVTPAVVAWTVAAVCALTALVGARLRGEREAFGNVLVGLGLGGLYVDTVGSHFYQEMLSGETMVAATFLLGLGALGFGARRGLPSFLGIGLFGGLIAALMPLSKGSVVVATVLFLIVTLPAFGVAAWRRWSMATVGVWGAGFLAALAILFASDVSRVRYVPLDASLLFAVAAWIYATERFPKGDPYGAFPFAAAVATGGAAILAEPGWKGASHTAMLGPVLMGLSGLFQTRIGRERGWAAGLLLSLAVAPLGLPVAISAAVLTGLAIGIALLAIVLLGKGEAVSTEPLLGIRNVVAALITIQMGLALAAYGVASANPVPHDAWLLTALIGAGLLVATVIGTKEARVLAGLVVWGLGTRLGVLGLGLAISPAITVSWTLVLAGFLLVGFATRRSELRQLGLAVAAAVTVKVALIDLIDLDPATKAGILLALGLILLGGGYAYVRARRT